MLFLVGKKSGQPHFDSYLRQLNLQTDLSHHMDINILNLNCKRGSTCCNLTLVTKLKLVVNVEKSKLILKWQGNHNPSTKNLKCSSGSYWNGGILQILGYHNQSELITYRKPCQKVKPQTMLLLSEYIVFLWRQGNT